MSELIGYVPEEVKTAAYWDGHTPDDHCMPQFKDRRDTLNFGSLIETGRNSATLLEGFLSKPQVRTKLFEAGEKVDPKVLPLGSVLRLHMEEYFPDSSEPSGTYYSVELWGVVSEVLDGFRIAQRVVILYRKSTSSNMFFESGDAEFSILPEKVKHRKPLSLPQRFIRYSDVTLYGSGRPEPVRKRLWNPLANLRRWQALGES